MGWILMMCEVDEFHINRVSRDLARRLVGESNMETLDRIYHLPGMPHLKLPAELCQYCNPTVE